MNIAIYGAEFINKGAEAMILTVADVLGEKIQDARFVIRLPREYFQDARQFGLKPVWRAHQNGPILHRACNKLINCIMYLHCKAVVDIGGYQFGDPWGLSRMWNIVKAASRHHRLGHPVVFMPQAWGPFTGAGWKEAMMVLLEVSDLCFVRDATSMREVEQLIGQKHPKIHFAHDIAWAFKGTSLEVGKAILSDSKGLTSREAVRVCVTPNYRVYERTEGQGKGNRYIRFLASAIEYLCREHDCQVILLGHEFFKKNRCPDDRTLCSLILSCVDPSLPVVHIDQELSAPEIKSVIGNCELLLSSRYHALIAALSQGIPAISLGWSHKYEELMTSVGLDRYILSLEEDKHIVQRKIDSAFSTHDDLRQIVANKIIPLKESAVRCLTLAAECITTRG